MRKLLLSLFFFCAILARESVADESWGNAMFTAKQHDFGRVALGADAEFRFELINIYESDVRLANVRSSCGCASASLSSTLLKPGETGSVIARLNTSGQYLRNTSAVLTVQLETVVNGSRLMDTVQLFVSGHIRSDIVLTPGSVEFGAVSEGTAVERIVQLEYTGRPGWALTKVERSQPFIHARAEEIRRERGDVVYRITATLKDDAPIGYIRDILRFTTNEFPSNRTEPIEIVLPVHGVVTTSIRAKPSPMLIGILEPGETATKNIVVRSETPFRITNVSASDNRFRFAFSEADSVVQLISVSFSARPTLLEHPQDIAEIIRISTNDPQQQNITVSAWVRVINPSQMGQ
jgi:hypothetical protein